MFEKIKNWLHKSEYDRELYVPKDAVEQFVLKLNHIEIGILECAEGDWSFSYSDTFKNLDEYYPIPGFPDLNEIYISKSLWPFFKIRIPGLGQPAVKEILQKENIDARNELELLKRFGFESIANPFILLVLE